MTSEALNTHQNQSSDVDAILRRQSIRVILNDSDQHESLAQKDPRDRKKGSIPFNLSYTMWHIFESLVLIDVRTFHTIDNPLPIFFSGKEALYECYFTTKNVGTNAGKIVWVREVGQELPLFGIHAAPGLNYNFYKTIAPGIVEDDLHKKSVTPLEAALLERVFWELNHLSYTKTKH